jgi:prevent-host-death family protein
MQQSMKQTVSITEFKSKCLAYMRDVDEKGAHLIITKHGKSIAEVQPVAPEQAGSNPLKGSVIFQKDLISSVEADWEALEP